MTNVHLDPSTPEFEPIIQGLNLKPSIDRLRKFIDNELVATEGEGYRSESGYFSYSLELVEDCQMKPLFEKIFVGFDVDFVKTKVRGFGLRAYVYSGSPKEMEISLEYNFGESTRPCFGELELTTDSSFDVTEAVLYFDDDADEQMVAYWILRGKD